MIIFGYPIPNRGSTLATYKEGKIFALIKRFIIFVNGYIRLFKDFNHLIDNSKVSAKVYIVVFIPKSVTLTI